MHSMQHGAFAAVTVEDMIAVQVTSTMQRASCYLATVRGQAQDHLRHASQCKGCTSSKTLEDGTMAYAVDAVNVLDIPYVPWELD